MLLLTDLGSGEYTKDYFSSKRYDILCNNSFSHSVPILNGRGQEEGNRYACSAFTATEDGRVRMEIGGAYAPVETGSSTVIPGITRELRFDLTDGSLEMKDTFVMEENGIQVLENLVTQIPPRVCGNGVILEKDGVRGCITICDFSGEEANIQVQEYDHRNHHGQIEKVYGIRWQVKLCDGRGESRIRVTCE